MKVEVKSLKVDLDGVLILKDVSLKVNKGEFFGIVGKNGSGKTTLLRALAKFYPKEGLIYIDGKEIGEISLDELAKIVGVVPQEFELNVNFTVEQFVALGRIPYIRIFESKMDRDVVNRVIESLKCPKKRIVRTLSGGEKQRVLIAKALAQEPKVLLLDEPTSHLDIKHQIEIVRILKSLAKMGLTVIATFHDLNLALNFCDRIAIMKDGRILKVCKPEEVDSDVLKEAFDVEVEVANLNGWKVVIPKV
ncbi:ABC transporter ATP-binding protein [Archaeoglobus sp.]